MVTLDTNQILRMLGRRLNEEDIPADMLIQRSLCEYGSGQERGNIQGDLARTLAYMKLEAVLCDSEFSNCYFYTDGISLTQGNYGIVQREHGLVIEKNRMDVAEYDGIIFVEGLPVLIEVNSGVYSKKAHSSTRYLVSEDRLREKLNAVKEVLGERIGMIVFLPDDEHTNAIRARPRTSNLAKFIKNGGEAIRLGYTLSALQGATDRLSKSVPVAKLQLSQRDISRYVGSWAKDFGEE